MPPLNALSLTNGLPDAKNGPLIHAGFVTLINADLFYISLPAKICVEISGDQRTIFPKIYRNVSPVYDHGAILSAPFVSHSRSNWANVMVS